MHIHNDDAKPKLRLDSVNLQPTCECHQYLALGNQALSGLAVIPQDDDSVAIAVGADKLVIEEIATG
jgi:hypothetical protein